MKLIAEAFHLGVKINLLNFRNQMKHEIVKTEHSFILYQISDYSYVYIKDYGSVVFLNVDQKVKDEFVDLLPGKSEEDIEQISVVIDPNERNKVGFESVSLQKLTDDNAHIIMLYLAQSVALDFYSKRGEELLHKVIAINRQLAESGKLNLSTKRIKKLIGETMELKNRLASSFFIYDTPDIAWEDEAISSLDAQLKVNFEVKERHLAIQQVLETLKENLEVFNDVMNHKNSTLLEWIVILLILIEVLQVIFYEH